VKPGFIFPSRSCGENGAVRLLLVEDDDALAGVLRRALVEDGYAVDRADRIVEACHLLDVNAYDLVVLDLGLPDGDGLRVCAHVRATASPVPILVLTARDGLSDKVAGLDAGADDYLTKPFDYPELAARVRALLRRPGEDRSPVLTAGDIRLDPASRRVWHGAITVPLTAREFALLEYLLRRRGQVVPRTDLIEHVWDANYDGLSNVVDVHVASLRRKLGLPGAPAPIETVRGVGYRIDGTPAGATAGEWAG
jgi:two-component system OmpR family response regulator